ncbi:MAG: nuclear transport factor 2 family protein [Acidobacteria bacterium]|nr:nuclear transport factor 2 family protein [Acidobacteriota bacterium]
MKTCSALLLLLTLAGSANAAQSVEQFNQSFADATRKMSNDATLALWEENGISLLPSTPPIVGKKAIATFLTNVLKDLGGAKMQSFDLACRDITIEGATATEWCTEHQVVDLGNGKTFDGKGKMLLVLHRGTDGKWRLLREMWNAW